jgi:hypothetical protein
MNFDAYCRGDALEVGTDAVLLLDRSTVEDRWGVRRVVNQPYKDPRNPVLMADMPWEDVAAHPNVIYDRDAGIWRMWYTGVDWQAYSKQFNQGTWQGAADGYPYFMCYAESGDGVNWERPLLDGHPYKEHARTNVVHVGRQKCASARVTPNHPATGQPGRFMLTYKDNLPGAKGALCFAYSDDGINWREDPANPIVPRLRDTWHHLVHDPIADRWLLITRPKLFAGVSAVPGGPTEHNYKRRMAVMVGDTPHSLGFPRVVLWPEEADDPDFDNFMVHRVGNHFVCFLASMSAPPFMTFNIHLATSGDGLHWHMLPERPIYLPHGGPDSVDAGSISDVGSLVDVGDSSFIYYRGSRKGQAQSNRNNQSAICRAQFKRQRFMAQMGAHTGGFLLTREMVVAAPRLVVNTTVADGHNTEPSAAIVPPEFACEVVRFEEGHWAPVPVPGYTLAACTTPATDLIELTVTWQDKADLSELVGQPVFFRFYLKNCGIYSLRFME